MHRHSLIVTVRGVEDMTLRRCRFVCSVVRCTRPDWIVAASSATSCPPMSPRAGHHPFSTGAIGPVHCSAGRMHCAPVTEIFRRRWLWSCAGTTNDPRRVDPGVSDGKAARWQRLQIQQPDPTLLFPIITAIDLCTYINHGCTRPNPVQRSCRHAVMMWRPAPRPPPGRHE
jgi:hypothetical protein